MLVGGGVCMDPDERIADIVSRAKPNFGELELWATSEQTLLADAGLGDEESWRDGSTGGNGRLGFGEG